MLDIEIILLFLIVVPLEENSDCGEVNKINGSSQLENQLKPNSENKTQKKTVSCFFYKLNRFCIRQLMEHIKN